MEEKDGKAPAKKTQDPQDKRRQRLKSALRENLKRRKQTPRNRKAALPVSDLHHETEAG